MRDQIQARNEDDRKEKTKWKVCFCFCLLFAGLQKWGGRVCICGGMISLISNMKGTVSGRAPGGRSRKIKS